MTLKRLLSFSKFKIFDLNLRQNFYSESKVNFLLNESDFLKINMEELLKLGVIFKFKYSDLKTLIESIYLKFNLKFICVTNGSINSSILWACSIVHYWLFKTSQELRMLSSVTK